jgi:hypothetical protein
MRLVQTSPRALALASVLALALASAPVALAACGDDSSSTSSSGTSGTQTACQKDTRKDAYASGLAKSGASFTVKLLDAQPAPPSKGTNTMTVQVLDASGKPVDGASVTLVPFMPDHGHGSAVAPIVKGLGADGKYTIEKVYLAMAGLWELRFNVQAPGAASSDVTFSFCLDG